MGFRRIVGIQNVVGAYEPPETRYIYIHIYIYIYI